MLLTSVSSALILSCPLAVSETIRMVALMFLKKMIDLARLLLVVEEKRSEKPYKNKSA
jgi:hypothetical protein